MPSLISILLILSLCVWSVQTASLSSAEDNSSRQKYHFWIHKSLSILRSISCLSIGSEFRDQCESMKRKETWEINVYTAEPSRNGGKIFATLPDRSLDRSGDHDGVVVFDPFPEGSFGHLVVAFFVDKVDNATCFLSGGIYSGKRIYAQISAASK